MAHPHSFFAHRQAQLKLAAALYVLGALLSHATFPPLYVWVVAAVFSIIMNLVYIIEAAARREFVAVELAVAVVLIVASGLGVIVAPIFVVSAVIGHGIWDLLKLKGAGVPFFAWYTSGCFVADMIYGAALLAYWALH